MENLLVKKACLKKVPLHIFYNEKVLLGLTFIKHHIPGLNIVKQGLHVCYQDRTVAEMIGANTSGYRNESTVEDGS